MENPVTITLKFIDPDTNEIQEKEHTVESEVAEYIGSVGHQFLILMEENDNLIEDIENMEVVIEGYRILCGGREVDN